MDVSAGMPQHSRLDDESLQRFALKALG